ncbi:hypothetical protein P9294_gp008 [Bacillus phage FADO]|uniref:Uncharacterized protein n=1 Tax=Bacillus phage FADO TaxID=2917160 RepID=A0AAE9GBL3_9CAUD|nr:hypothetical protein P9294_gp008 [Bacillus phage FADO]UNY48723.1 hypothetical protein fado_8 [Bacillus phage FADO]
MDTEFEELQDRMIERASIYKGTELDSFYRFVIGEMDWEECVKRVAKNIG